MVYKLDEADKLCGVTYIDWSKKYSPIPKATCEMLKQQCGSGDGSDNTPELTCEDIKKLLKGEGSEDIPELSCEEIKKLLKGEDKPKEEKPKEDKPKEDTPNEGNKEEIPKENDTPKDENPKEDKPKEPDTPTGEKPKEDEKPKEENPSDNVGGNPTEDKPKEPTVLTNEELENIIPRLSTDTTLGNYKVTPKNNLIGVEYPDEDTITNYKKEVTDKAKGIPELEGYTVEVIVDKIPSPEPQVGEPLNQAPLYTKIIKITKPNGDVYTTEPMNIGTTKEEEFSILDVMPKVEGNFSIVTHNNGLVKSVTGDSPQQKSNFENSIITYLKGKLPEGAVVEAVLGEPSYKEGSELITGRTNYTLNVRVTLNGKVYEQAYNVPHIEEEELVVTNPDEPELDLSKVRVEYPETFSLVVFDEMPDVIGAYELEKPGYKEKVREDILNQLNDERKNPLLKGFKKEVVFYRDREVLPKVGDNPYNYGNEISPIFLVTLISPGNKVYRNFIPTGNKWMYTSQEVYNRGK